jgi:ABC-type uncharacterized transport system permease subunit
MSVLSYGSLAMASVTGGMFLVLDHMLKEHHLQSRWFRVLPPVRALLVAMVRLLRLGVLLLTIGIACGAMAARDAGIGSAAHFVAAMVVWVAYLVLLVVREVRGLTGRRLALSVVLLFLVSLSVFAFL